jgi:hypothetical protein
MDIHQTISYKTMIGAKSIGYDNFPIIHKVLPTMKIRKTCTAMMLHDWIETNHNLRIEVKYDESQLWGYILWRKDKLEWSYIDNDSLFETEEIAFDEGLQRAIYEIKSNFVF